MESAAGRSDFLFAERSSDTNSSSTSNDSKQELLEASAARPSAFRVHVERKQCPTAADASNKSRSELQLPGCTAVCDLKALVGTITAEPGCVFLFDYFLLLLCEIKTRHLSDFSFL